MASLTSPTLLNDVFSFSVWRGPMGRMARPHVHPDIELNLVLSGEAQYFMADRLHTLHAGTLAAFWAGMPHVTRHAAPQTEMIWVVIPLARFLGWRLPAPFGEGLLQGRLRVWELQGDLVRRQFERWCEENGGPRRAHEGERGGEAQKIFALEVEACLRRLLLQGESGDAAINTSGANALRASSQQTHHTPGEQTQFEKIAAYLSAHYSQEISVETVAHAVGLHPHYAMQLFRAQCGLSLWEYVLRLRVSHAQYLLLSTERKITDIARDAGFGSPSRFYAAFEKYAGQSPRQWRSLRDG